MPGSTGGRGWIGGFVDPLGTRTPLTTVGPVPVGFDGWLFGLAVAVSDSKRIGGLLTIGLGWGFVFNALGVPAKFGPLLPRILIPGGLGILTLGVVSLGGVKDGVLTLGVLMLGVDSFGGLNAGFLMLGVDSLGGLKDGVLALGGVNDGVLGVLIFGGVNLGVGSLGVLSFGVLSFGVLSFGGDKPNCAKAVGAIPDKKNTNTRIPVPSFIVVPFS